jgi:hypothetical protein
LVDKEDKGRTILELLQVLDTILLDLEMDHQTFEEDHASREVVAGALGGIHLEDSEVATLSNVCSKMVRAW